ncbi:hypothetical protein FAZ95_38720 [Trinickia violacea]|uniref:Fis family transcriptional regulator n=1 Tax=Trinickia violacea TaxID=2571746 RepID=A0A4P8J2G0_9BURK|nr:hypothetical protein [Trinickia violacea]QCP55076.1 hypothetical protein FAZ95_38720 [Trinickia violacea]
MRNRKPRRPLTKSELLPLPPADVSRLSLKNHLALAALRAGQADDAMLTPLMNVLYFAYFLRDAAAIEQAELALFQRAEAALEACVTRGEVSGVFALTEDDRPVLEQLVSLHDAQLASVPRHRLLDAWARVDQVTRSGGRSPIPTAEAP